MANFGIFLLETGTGFIGSSRGMRGITRDGFDKKAKNALFDYKFWHFWAICDQSTSGNPPIGDNLAEYPKHVCLISTENIFSDDDLTSQRPALTTVHCAKSANCLYTLKVSPIFTL